MSGGNQQKAIVAREIDKNPELLVAVQPTRGLDVGAIEYIHKQLVAERDAGKGVLLVSLELDEVMDTQRVGEASALLGAGRQKKEDAIDYGAGIVLKKKTGDFAEAGEPLAELYTNTAATLAESERVFLSALRWQDAAPEKQPLIYGVVG